jgi:hypothetical protein
MYPGESEQTFRRSMSVLFSGLKIKLSMKQAAGRANLQDGVLIGLDSRHIAGKRVNFYRTTRRCISEDRTLHNHSEGTLNLVNKWKFTSGGVT